MEPEFTKLAESLAATSSAFLTVAKYQADVDREFATESLGLKTFPTIVFLPKNSTKVIRYPSERRDAETLGMWVRSIGATA